VEALVRQFEFWFWYFSLSYPDLDLPPEFEHLDANEIFKRLDAASADQRITLRFPDHVELNILFPVGTIELWLNFENQEMQLGWVDGHFCPEAFRLEELQIVVRQLTESDYAPALLLQFLSLCSEEDLMFARSTLAETLVNAEILSRAEADVFSDMVFHDGLTPSAWEPQNGIWIPSGDTYSMRAEDYFDHERFARFIASRGSLT